MSQESIANKTVRTAFWSSIQKFSTMGISFVVSMVLARLLTPEDYGTIALMSVFFAISGSIAECGFSNALIRKSECTQADYSTAFFYNVGVSFFLYLMIFLGAPFVAEFYDKPILIDVMRVSGLSLIIGSANMTQSVQLTRKLEFKKFAIIALVASIISGVVGVTCAYAGMGVWALVVSSLTGSVINAVVLILVVRWKPSFSISRDSFGYLWSFGSKMLVSGIISNIYANIYSIVIGKTYDARTLGIYNRGQSLALLCPDIINSIFNRNTLPILAQLQNDKKRLIDVYRKLVRLVSFFNIPACLIFAALARPFILFFLTDKWEVSVIYVQLFCLSAITSSAGAINLNIFQAEGRSDIVLKIEVIKKTIGFLLVFSLMWFNPLILAIGSVTFNFFCYVLNLHYARKLENMSLFTQISDLAPSFFASVAAAALTYFVTLLPLSYFCQLLVGGLVGIGAYFIITRFILHMEIYDQVESFVKARRDK